MLSEFVSGMKAVGVSDSGCGVVSRASLDSFPPLGSPSYIGINRRNSKSNGACRGISRSLAPSIRQAPPQVLGGGRCLDKLDMTNMIFVVLL